MQTATPTDATTGLPVAAAAPEHPQLQTVIDVRSVSLAILALLATIVVLQWARDFFIPLVLGVMASYALSPVVAWLQRWHVPRVIGAALLLGLGGASIGWMVYSLSDEAAGLAEAMPAAAQKLRDSVRSAPDAAEGTIEKMQRAAETIEEAANDDSPDPPEADSGFTRVRIERPQFDVKDFLWGSTLGFAGAVGQALAVLFLTYFLLVSGDSFRRKMVRIAGPTFTQKKITLQVLDQITGQIQRYLMVQLLTSALVGIVIWLVLSWIGLKHAAVWGVVAALFNLIPYLGALLTAAGLTLAAFLQFGTLGMAALVGGAALVVNTLEGSLLTPWLTGRASRMNPVVIFIGVLAWGWLWGLWGLFLGPPLLMIVKSVCDGVEDLKHIGELLGE